MLECVLGGKKTQGRHFMKKNISLKAISMPKLDFDRTFAE